MENFDEVGPAFVESVILLQTHWFSVTSFSVFTHDPNRVNDCYGASSFELVIRIGYIEILANSGFIGSLEIQRINSICRVCFAEFTKADIIKAELLILKDTTTICQFGLLLNKYKGHFENQFSKRVDSNKVWGRELFYLKQVRMVCIMIRAKACLNHMNVIRLVYKDPRRKSQLFQVIRSSIKRKLD
ncbi:uncharacterized protein RHIMIDRAFT_293149 [Rhizopus microsporus ATCC 52813]|uniref:Uncharacterized protein n=1 Tax=Rhizopus microsporus ATCC 52813 TaxID=1340429 RepID=A0A2G4SQD2_RHIZD|nr:uncharacterized protein RHIMIDRAFT_293149 [Rhizopus microsporus ATCC 52813]PHZ10942.1 hypothetical protein RHIMIDRAFT_293149 [Rhizopus microsporus ATCC 52813]